MDRKHFLKILSLLPLSNYANNINTINKLTDALPGTDKMPVLFLGHGSPMNAIQENEFVTGFRDLAKTLPRPQAIICVSAHYYTNGTFITAMEKPKTIHDFGGFPQALFDVQYPAPGKPELAKETKSLIKKASVGLDEKDWGLDHGAWSVIKHLYPKADVPVLELSIDYTKPASWHYELAKELATLRNKGVLIVGSGNIVHNLYEAQFNKPGLKYDWAIEAREKINKLITDSDHRSLCNYNSLGTAIKNAVPTPDHFLPLIYTLALKEEKDLLSLLNDKIVSGSLSMTSVVINK